nr:MAG TPA: hypothetical protein [Caudoviricetes sp.]
MSFSEVAITALFFVVVISASKLLSTALHIFLHSKYVMP